MMQQGSILQVDHSVTWQQCPWITMFMLLLLRALKTKRKAVDNTHTQPFYGSVDFVWDNPGEPVPEETFTHSHL